VKVLIDYRPALRDRSGAGEYIHQLVRALVTTLGPSSLNVTLFSSSWKDRLSLAPELNGVEAIDRRIPVRLLNLAWHRLGWPPVEALSRTSFDVTHAPHPLIVPSRRAAHVVTIHDVNFLTNPERTRAEIRRDYPALARAHALRADGIFVPSKFTAAELARRFGVASDRITICPPGAPDWPPRPSAPPQGHVLFLGTLEPRKNVGGLLDAYEKLALKRPVPTLVLAGSETSESRVWLDRLARTPLNRVARYVGYVDAERRRQLYEGARLVVQPSFEEGFGMVVLEAMTVGVPVVAANRGSLPEVLGDAGILIDPERSDELAEAIERMLDDPQFADACAAKGVAGARRFRWDISARRAYDAYRQAAEHRVCASA
jgi:glycosyltransferase involved in cell wall biosynthesis